MPKKSYPGLFLIAIFLSLLGSLSPFIIPLLPKKVPHQVYLSFLKSAILFFLLGLLTYGFQRNSLLSKKVFQLGLLVLFFLDRSLINSPQFFTANYDFFVQEIPLIHNLQSKLKQEGFFRFFVEDTSSLQSYILDPRNTLETQLTRQKHFLLSHLTYRIPSIRGSGVMDLKKLDRMVTELEVSKDSKLLSLLGGRYVLTLRTDRGMPEPQVYENRFYLPRLVFIRQIKVFQTESDLLNWMLKNSYEPQKLALVLKPVGKAGSTGFGMWPEFQVLDSENLIVSGVNSQHPLVIDHREPKIQITQETVNRLSAHIETTTSGLLLLNDTFFPGWRAQVNQIPKELLEVNYLFKGILLTPGRYEVIFSYEPFSYKLGVFITLWTFMMLIGWRIYEPLRSKIHP